MKIEFNPFTLDELKEQAKASIDAEAERIRQKHLTPGEGQAMTYLVKEREAVAFLADQNTNPASLPHLVAESAALGMTVSELAQTVIATAAIWHITSAHIEATRRKAKSDVDAAETPRAVRLATIVNWTLAQ